MIKKATDRKYDRLLKEYEALRHERDEAIAELHRVSDASRGFAREKARRTEQFRALLQATNLILAVASNEIIDFDAIHRRH
jgi:predicted nuclease with TOPRIM domain